MKEVDLGEPTSFLDHVYLGALKENVNEMCMVTHQLDCCGKDNSKKLYLNSDGRKYRVGNVCSFIEKQRFFCQYLWTSRWLETEAEYGFHIEKDDEHCGY